MANRMKNPITNRVAGIVGETTNRYVVSGKGLERVGGVMKGIRDRNSLFRNVLCRNVGV
jgi:hypothetical protein